MNVTIQKLDPLVRDYSSAIARLYLFEKWISPSDDYSRINQAVKNSFCAFGAFDGDLMIGFFRALSDGISDAYLLDLVVDPTYRNQGIAAKLTEAILTELRKSKLLWITCISNPGVDKLYSKFGSAMQDYTPFRF